MYGKILGSAVSLLLLAGVAIGVVVLLKSNESSGKDHTTNASVKMVATICEPTSFKDACAKALEPVAKTGSTKPQDYVLAAVQATLDEVRKSLDSTGKNMFIDVAKDKFNAAAWEDCKDLLDDAIDTLQDIVSLMATGDIDKILDRDHELRSWLTAAYTLQTTCIDQFEMLEFKSVAENGMINSTKLAHNAVSIAAHLSQLVRSITNSGSAAAPGPARRLLMTTEDGFPNWFGAADRRLLADVTSTKITPHVVVAQDGSGQFRTIKEAVAAYPKKHQGRFIIQVKAGIYKDEGVVIDKRKPNIFMFGDGIGKTIVTGRKNFFFDKFNTMRTATFAVAASGFIARGMTFINDAGPEAHQAVAFRSQGDMTALFDCSFEGYQDTLYYQSKRQFYRNCQIHGSLDFIFGKGDCVIQDSEIIVRKPLADQYGMVTADGKEIDSGTGGLVLQNCKIVPDKRFFLERFGTRVYLGRPWKKDALVVVMQSELGDFIRPEGWFPWVNEQFHKTCRLYEFDNRGPGAKTDQRSKEFPHFRVLTDPQEAAKYTPGQFLAGHQWLPQSGVPHRLGL